MIGTFLGYDGPAWTPITAEYQEAAREVMVMTGVTVTRKIPAATKAKALDVLVQLEREAKSARFKAAI